MHTPLPCAVESVNGITLNWATLCPGTDWTSSPPCHLEFMVSSSSPNPLLSWQSRHKLIAPPQGRLAARQGPTLSFLWCTTVAHCRNLRSGIWDPTHGDDSPGAQDNIPSSTTPLTQSFIDIIAVLIQDLFPYPMCSPDVYGSHGPTVSSTQMSATRSSETHRCVLPSTQCFTKRLDISQIILCIGPHHARYHLLPPIAIFQASCQSRNCHVPLNQHLV